MLPVTTVKVIRLVGGVKQLVQISYTQKCSSIHSQGPTPHTGGGIGLGTLTGVVGIVETDTANSGASEKIGVSIGEVVFKLLGMLAVWA